MRARAKLVSQAVEQVLAERVPAPFAPSVRTVERTAFGIAAVDALAQGGVPSGAITELVGSACSGRTTAALHLVRQFTARGGVCAWVDVADALDPASAAAIGVDLGRLLWVRCTTPAGSGDVLRQPELPESATWRDEAALRSPAGESSCARITDRNIPESVQKMLGAHGGLLDHQRRREQRVIGTPGSPNRPVVACTADPGMQHRDAQPGVTVRCAEPQPRRGMGLAASTRLHVKRSSQPSRMEQDNPWQALDHALRATDLLLTNGGFAAIVLDLGSTPAEFAWRIPLATWFRYRAACDRSRCSLVLLTQHPCARSSAGLVLRMEPGTMEADGPVMSGIQFQAELERSRFTEPHARVVSIRKPPQGERRGGWKSEAVWA